MPIYKISVYTESCCGQDNEIKLEHPKDFTDQELSDIVNRATKNAINKGLKNENKMYFYTTHDELRYDEIYEPLIAELKILGFKEIVEKSIGLGGYLELPEDLKQKTIERIKTERQLFHKL